MGRVTFALECVPPIPIPNGILDESSPGAYWWLSSLSSLPSSLASDANVLRGSSRVPAPLSGAGTRDVGSTKTVFTVFTVYFFFLLLLLFFFNYYVLTYIVVVHIVK